MLIGLLSWWFGLTWFVVILVLVLLVVIVLVCVAFWYSLGVGCGFGCGVLGCYLPVVFVGLAGFGCFCIVVGLG